MSLSNKVHSKGNVPFSWENKPGVSKVIIRTTLQDCLNGNDGNGHCLFKLPPPPFPAESKKFSVTYPGSSLRKGLGLWNNNKHEQQDPFLVAFKECTKNPRNCSMKSSNKNNKPGIIKGFFSFGCKPNSCSVNDNNWGKVAQLRYFN